MIAILGATGYIGRSLARVIALSEAEPLVLFARRVDMLHDESWPAHVSIRALDTFRADECDVVINAIGAGAPTKLAMLGAEILSITQSWDERVLATMRAETGYVFLSSGAIYGSHLDRPVDADWKITLPVNRLGSIPPYTIAKLYSEARHRNLAQHAILDVRVFGFADITIPHDSSFFLADLVRSVVRREQFETSPDEMIRDYAGADELWSLIRCWRNTGRLNRALDLYSTGPVSKQALLEMAQSRFGLKISVSKTGRSQTGARPVYASSFHAAADIGYLPWRSSMEIVTHVLDLAARGSASE